MAASTPVLSVIMSVYNAEKYLKEAISSVLDQTYNNFEFIIINDASTDSSLEIIKSFDDNRIVLIEKKENKGFKGFVENLNIGLDNSRGEYIARMDADDICYLNRFQTQIEYLNDHPEIFMIGNTMDLIDENGNFLKKQTATLNFNKIVNQFNYNNPMFHPTLMFRSTSIRYRDSFIGCEDFDFHLQHLSKGLKFENLSESLLKYRLLDQSISRSTNKLKILIGMESARNSYLERKNGNSTFNDEILNRYLNNNLTEVDKKNILSLAIKYNLQDYKKLLQDYNNKSIYYNLFRSPFLRRLYSKITLRYCQKITL